MARRSGQRVEVTNVSRWGFWLLLGGRELFVSFNLFPWFRDVSTGQLVDVALPHPGHLHWQQLDVDLAVDSIEHPDRYPLVSKPAPALPSARRAVVGPELARHRARV